MSADHPPLERALDANANRAAEGLRVLEDLARFCFDDPAMAATCKELRHELRAAVGSCGLAWRDTAGDVGTRIKAADEGHRSDLAAVIIANAKRACEACRVLAEFGFGTGYDALAASAEACRYRLYDLERDALQRLPRHRLRQERLYVLVDPDLCADPVGTATAAVLGGAGIVQLRGKQLSQIEYLRLAESVQDAVRGVGGLFVVNDHVAVARAIGADGIHVGQEDLPPTAVRRVVGPVCLIGVSCHARADVLAAQEAGADYLGLGPMFATTTKAHEPVRGPALLDAVREDLRLPSYCIGGLDVRRVADLGDAIPHGVALSSAICGAADVTAACRAVCSGWPR